MVRPAWLKSQSSRSMEVAYLLCLDFIHTQIHWTASFLFSHSPHRSPCMIRSRVLSCVWSDLVSCSCTIRSLGSLLYDINLWATATTILNIRGVQIPIDLVSSATDSYRRSVVLFKPMSVPTSDPKSEFLCQLSSIAQNLQAPLKTPRTPGISPTPSSPRITHTVTIRVLSPSTWSRSSVYNGQSDSVVACQLKLSRTFNSNVTLFCCPTSPAPRIECWYGDQSAAVVEAQESLQMGWGL